VAVSEVLADALAVAVVAAVSAVFVVLEHSFMVVHLGMDTELHWDP
jgi:hypothetical protein